MLAKIYKPTKTAMQSGTAQSTYWLLEYLPEEKRGYDPLMGWTSSSDMNSQIKLKFSSKEEAVSYAKRNGIPYYCINSANHTAKKPKSYSDNFKFGRVGRWTH